MKVILFANTDWYLYNFRFSLAKALRDKGVEVVLVSPSGEYANRLREADFRWLEIPLSKSKVNPFADIISLIRLWNLYRKERPAVVHHYTVKCVVYGSCAAHLAGIKAIVNSVTGLGFVFTDNSPIRKLLQGVVLFAYRIVLRNTRIIFQNPTDRDLFLSMKLTTPDRVELIRGSGVDIDLFQPRAEPQGMPVVLFPGRFLKDKGIVEFVESARIINNNGVKARFILAGDLYEGNPSSISARELQSWTDERVVEWWGWSGQMQNIYPLANIVCLPSYREGLSRTLVEACACRRAVVTTDVPGCRDVVKHGENGYLVPPKDPGALAKAILELIRFPETRRQMAMAGRKIAERDFSTEKIIRETLDVYRKQGLSTLEIKQ
jgi:glycosyltransferase involved in cell wall biosynthesis